MKKVINLTNPETPIKYNIPIEYLPDDITEMEFTLEHVSIKMHLPYRDYQGKVFGNTSKLYTDRIDAILWILNEVIIKLNSVDEALDKLENQT